MAVRALGKVTTETAVPILVDIATSDAALEVREAAVRALGELGDPRAAEALMQIANEN